MDAADEDQNQTRGHKPILVTCFVFPPPVSPDQHLVNFSHSVLALAVGRFLYVRNLLFAQDVGIASNETIIMQEIEMMMSVSTNVIITLRPFAKELNTSFGQGGGAIIAYGLSSAYGGISGGGGEGAKSSSRSNDRGFGSIIADRLGLSSRGGGMGKSAGRSSEPGADWVGLEDWKKSSRNNRAERRMVETSDSSRDLTGDVIRQTVDYHVEYEEKSEDGERSRGAERW